MIWFIFLFPRRLMLRVLQSDMVCREHHLIDKINIIERSWHYYYYLLTAIFILYLQIILYLEIGKELNISSIRYSKQPYMEWQPDCLPGLRCFHDRLTIFHTRIHFLFNIFSILICSPAHKDVGWGEYLIYPLLLRVPS